MDRLRCTILEQADELLPQRTLGVHMASLDQSATYSISFQGGIDPHLLDMYGPLRAEEAQDEEGRAITILPYVVADQAAIVGIIRTLHSMGIVLLSVQRGANRMTPNWGGENHVSHVA